MSKRIFITSGPTWVALDAVRIITNTATGLTGFLLAGEAKKRGYRVTLALGPVENIGDFCCAEIKRFRYFDDLYQLIKKELSHKKYDIVIHAAAVSDYKPYKALDFKINSSRNFTLRLKPTPKIANSIKKINPDVYLVLFKLECGVSDRVLINRARDTLVRAGADLVVANRLTPCYKAFILDKENIYANVDSRRILAKKLFDVMASHL